MITAEIAPDIQMLKRMARVIFDRGRPYQGMAGITTFDDMERSGDTIAKEVQAYFMETASLALAEALRKLDTET